MNASRRLNSEDDINLGGQNPESDLSSEEGENEDDYNQRFNELEGRSDRLGDNHIPDDALSEISSSQASTEGGDHGAVALRDEPIEPYDFDNLPAHKCAYCGVHEVSAVVKCIHQDC